MPNWFVAASLARYNRGGLVIVRRVVEGIPPTGNRRERHWRHLGEGKSSMSEILPPGEELPLSLAERVEEVCAAFETAWKAGQRPRIEDFLGDTSAPEHVALVRELLLLEVYYRQRASEV